MNKIFATNKKWKMMNKKHFPDQIEKGEGLWRLDETIRGLWRLQRGRRRNKTFCCYVWIHKLQEFFWCSRIWNTLCRQLSNSTTLLQLSLALWLSRLGNKCIRSVPNLTYSHFTRELPSVWLIRSKLRSWSVYKIGRRWWQTFAIIKKGYVECWQKSWYD